MKLIILIVALGLGTLVWSYRLFWVNASVQQPIEFPHKTHLELGLPCTTCHQRAEKDVVAGRPPTALCLGCHSGGDSKSPEIEKLKNYGEKGQEIPWQRVWRLPPHVFFSHRIHVTIAKLDCQSCHGPMETLDRPPARALKTLTMDDCIDCHTKSKTATRKANAAHPDMGLQFTNDCNACHR